MLLTIILIILLLIFFSILLLLSTILRPFFGRHKRKNVAYRKGNTTIVSHGKEQSEVPKDLGDYIDYEEVKNKHD
ncbi:MAG: hypothetical protein FWF09_06090 [Bacteroidales bacterium]|nr:hypothetical protein [Bacteroidales bacterium]